MFITQVCCICNTFHVLANTTPISADENALVSAPGFHFAESDTRDASGEGLAWGEEVPAGLRRICSKCHRHMASKKQVPPYAWVFLRQPAVPKCLETLNRVERQLVARGSAVHKVLLLPRGQQSGTVGSCCSYLLEEPRMYATLQESLGDVSVVRVEMEGSSGGKQWGISVPRLRMAARFLTRNNQLYFAERGRVEEELHAMAADVTIPHEGGDADPAVTLATHTITSMRGNP